MGKLSAADLEKTRETLVAIAEGGGRILLDGWGTHPKTESKTSQNDLVTEFDRRSEQHLVSQLRLAFPSYDIVAEEGESVQRANAEGVIYVDPLDGTTNFAHGLPIFGISIGLCVDGAPVAGVVYAPALGWTLSASEGARAVLGERTLAVSETARVAEALIATGFSAGRLTPDFNIPEFVALPGGGMSRPGRWHQRARWWHEQAREFSSALPAIDAK